MKTEMVDEKQLKSQHKIEEEKESWKDESTIKWDLLFT